MKGIQITSGWILLIIAGLAYHQIDMVSAIYSMEDTCKYIKEGFIANPDSCKSYGYCQNGKLIGTLNCPKDTYYNANDGVCQYKPVCRLKAESVCENTLKPTFVADPYNCSRYCYCENGLATCQSCPQYQVFDPKEIQCKWQDDINVKCNANPICRLVQNSMFAADPDKCGNFILCSFGNGVSKECPRHNGQQLYFDPRSGNCQREKYCVDNGDEDIHENIEPQPNKCYGQPEDNITFIQDGITCMGYYICTGNGTGGIWAKCPFGTHFNDGKCVTPYTFPCKYDRCANLNATFIGAINSECKNYLYCKNGAYIGNDNYKGKPCANNNYFDEYFQQCVPQSPIQTNKLYKLC